MPGRANTFSVTTAPASSEPNWMPATVITGTSAFLSAWRSTTRDGAQREREQERDQHRRDREHEGVRHRFGDLRRHRARAIGTGQAERAVADVLQEAAELHRQRLVEIHACAHLGFVELVGALAE